LYCIFFVFTLALLCFCVAAKYSVNKDIKSLTVARQPIPRRLLIIANWSLNIGSSAFIESGNLLPAPCSAIALFVVRCPSECHANQNYLDWAWIWPTELVATATSFEESTK